MTWQKNRAERDKKRRQKLRATLIAEKRSPEAIERIIAADTERRRLARTVDSRASKRPENEMCPECGQPGVRMTVDQERRITTFVCVCGKEFRARWVADASR